MKLACIAHSRFYDLYDVSKMAQVTKTTFDTDARKKLKRLDAVSNYICANSVSSVIPKIDSSSLRVTGFMDASFANDRDHVTQLGFIILVVDKFNVLVLNHFKLYKARRVAPSVLGGELIVFSDMVDYSIS